MEQRIREQEARAGVNQASASQHSNPMQGSSSRSIHNVGVFNDDLAEEAKFTASGSRMMAPVPAMLREETHNSGSGNVIGNAEDFENMDPNERTVFGDVTSQMNNTPEMRLSSSPTPNKSGGRKGKVKTRKQLKEASVS